MALSRCSGVLAIPQLLFSYKLRRTFNLKQKVRRKEPVPLEEMDEGVYPETYTY
jgi:hypothetical protein